MVRNGNAKICIPSSIPRFIKEARSLSQEQERKGLLACTDWKGKDRETSQETRGDTIARTLEHLNFKYKRVAWCLEKSQISSMFQKQKYFIPDTVLLFFCLFFLCCIPTVLKIRLLPFSPGEKLLIFLQNRDEKVSKMKKSGINRSSNNITRLIRGITWSKEHLMTLKTTSAAFYSCIC